MPGYSYDELTKVPFVMKVISEIRAPGSTFQRAYNLGLSSTPGQTLPHRTGVYDIFDPTRSMPVSVAPMRGPARVARKPVGQKIITVPRFFEALVIEDEYVFRNRPLGGQYGTVDVSGQTYIRRQLNHQIQKFVNVHEFMAVNLLRGGWGLKPFGEDLYPVLKDDPGATMVFDSLVDASQQGQLPLGDGGADIIDVSWDNPAADIHTQLLKLNVVHAARHGAPLKHIWLNGNTIAPLFLNTKLQSIGGSVYKVYDSKTGVQKNPDEAFPDTGVDVVFRALPEYVFHVYNQVIIPGQTKEDRASQIDSSNYVRLIPDNEIIITPEAGDWCELVAGSEPMQYAENQPAKVVSGFDMGRARAIMPPRWDLMFLMNQCPVLVQPYATYNPTVIFT